MARKRDYVAEILSKKTRLLKRSSRWAQFQRRHDLLFEAYRHVKNIKGNPDFRIELLRYIRKFDSQKWAVLYKRKDGNYGLVEPE